jgi:hypothetical protein
VGVDGMTSWSIALSCSRAQARAVAFVLNVFDILCPLRRIYARQRSPTDEIEAFFFARNR